MKKICSRIADPAVKVVSFDIFDTLLVRPAGREADRFSLLNRKFRTLSGAAVSFARLRTEAEAVLRRRVINNETEREDFTLSEIYETLSSEFFVPGDTAAEMQREELSLEKRLLRPRNSGKKLFEAALQSGKRIIIVSDMYHTAPFLSEVLKENGYTGFERIFVSSEEGLRKLSGRLFEHVLKVMEVLPGEVLHIGDNAESDIRIPAEKEIQTAWLPSAGEMFSRYGCARLPQKICTDLTDWQKAESSSGIGVFRQMAANMYFDDPFRSFDPETDADRDPYFAGYAFLGPELFALIRWLSDSVQRDGRKKLIFSSRDGFLPMKAYEIYRNYHPELPEAHYFYLSRLSMLPAMLRDRADFFDLPVDLNYQTAKKLRRILSFAADPEKEEKNDPQENDVLDREKSRRFIKRFLTEEYDPEAHAASLKRAGDYLRTAEAGVLTDDAAVFDMGYSGRMAAAVVHASGKHPVFYYFHANAGDYKRFEALDNIKIRSFFDFDPYMEAALREYAYLEPAASCIGYDAQLHPVFDIGPAEGYTETAELLQRGALQFIKDLMETFGEFETELYFRNHDASMMFEAFLLYCSEGDRTMFDQVLFDDELWGGRRDIDLGKLMEARRRKLPAWTNYKREKAAASEEEKAGRDRKEKAEESGKERSNG